MNTSLLCEERLNSLVSQLQSLDHLRGDVVELGVYKGGSLRKMAEIMHLSKSPDHIYGFDSFKGMPDLADSTIDHHKEGEFGDTSFHMVSEYVKPYPVKLHEGSFPFDHYAVIDHIEKIKFGHFDGDLYQSCQSFLLQFHRKVLEGGILVFDDYDWQNCHGVAKAVHEFLGKYPEDWVIHRRINMQISIRKVVA